MTAGVARHAVLTLRVQASSETRTSGFQSSRHAASTTRRPNPNRDATLRLQRCCLATLSCPLADPRVGRQIASVSGLASNPAPPDTSSVSPSFPQVARFKVGVPGPRTIPDVHARSARPEGSRAACPERIPSSLGAWSSRAKQPHARMIKSFQQFYRLLFARAGSRPPRPTHPNVASG